FAAVPLILRYVSRSDYGLWITLGEAMGYLTILDFGTGSAITRMVARLGADPDPKKLSRLFSTAMFVNLMFAGIFFSVAGGLMIFLPHWHAIPPDRTVVARNLVMLMALRAAFTFPIRVAANTLVGMQRQALVNLYGIIGLIAAP